MNVDKRKINIGFQIFIIPAMLQIWTRCILTVYMRTVLKYFVVDDI